jgi:tetratricopeptide (TPR) repeat protein
MADLGDAYLVARNVKEAEKEYNEIKRLAPKNALGYAKLGGLYMTQGSWDKAARELQIAFDMNPQLDPVLTSLAQVYAEQKKYASAIALCDSRIKNNPRDAFAYNVKGVIYEAQNDLQRAGEFFQKAIDIQPLWAKPHNNLVRTLVGQGKTAQAVTNLEAAIKANPAVVGPYLSLGQIYEQTGEYKKAIQVYERLLEKQADFWVGMNNLASLLSDHSSSKKDLEKALNLALNAQKTRPDDPSVLDTLGWIYYRQNDANKALEFIKRA